MVLGLLSLVGLSRGSLPGAQTEATGLLEVKLQTGGAVGWPRPQGRGDRPTSWWGVTTVPTFEGSLPPGVLASRCAVAPGTGPRRPGGGRRAGAPTWQRVGRGRNADKRLRAWPLPGVPHRPREHSVGTQGTLTARGIRSRGPARLDPGQVRLWAQGPAGCRSTASGRQPVSFPTPVRPWGTSWRVAYSHVSHPCSPPSLGLPGLSAKPGSPDGFIHRVRCSWTSCRPARWLPQLFSSGRGSRWAGEGRQAGGAPGQPGNRPVCWQWWDCAVRPSVRAFQAPCTTRQKQPFLQEEESPLVCRALSTCLSDVISLTLKVCPRSQGPHFVPR